MIKILGLGPGDKNSLTLGAIEALKTCETVFLRTEKHPTVDYIKYLNINFKTYDNFYQEYDSFDEVYASIAKDLVINHERFKNIVYAVPGHPLVAEKSVLMTIDICKEQNIEYEILPAVSFVESMMESLKIDPIGGITIVDAFEINKSILHNSTGLIITQVYNKLIASEVKLSLLEYYDDSAQIYFVRGAGIKDIESVRKIKLYELDRQEDIDYLTSIYVPKETKALKDFYDLLNIMEILRGENGCPWDLEQDHKSLKRCLIEEVYEVIDAINIEDTENLVEELGDLLLQVVFHAKIGKDEGYFNIYDITDGICNKMINRHPHIFGKINLDRTEDVLDNWEEIKKQEKDYRSYTEQLKHISKSLPGLIRAEKVQSKASKAGFDWDNIKPALEKIKEEYFEVIEVYNSKNREKILDELGDLIFATVNVCRFLKIDPEEAINHTTEKFIKRFEFIEKKATENGYDIEKMTLDEMDKLWNLAKTK